MTGPPGTALCSRLPSGTRHLNSIQARHLATRWRQLKEGSAQGMREALGLQLEGSIIIFDEVPSASAGPSTT